MNKKSITIKRDNFIIINSSTAKNIL